MVFGTFVGAAADRTGRKKAALTYVAAYSLGCFTKHSSSFSVLLVGRLLCGVATSLLYSAFESWLVAEHFRRGYDADLLGGTFAKAVFIGNGLVAIVGAGIIFYSETKRESFRERGRERERKRERAAGRFWREKNSPLLNDPEKKKHQQNKNAAGLLAHVLVETFALGPTAPFDAAATVLAVGGLIVATTWPENFGEQKDASPASAVAGGSSSAAASAGSSSASSPKRTFAGQLQHAASAIAADPKIALLGAMQALFEGTGFFVSFWRSVSWGFSLRRKKKSFEMEKKKKPTSFPFFLPFSLSILPPFFSTPLSQARCTPSSSSGPRPSLLEGTRRSRTASSSRCSWSARWRDRPSPGSF